MTDEKQVRSELDEVFAKHKQRYGKFAVIVIALATLAGAVIYLSPSFSGAGELAATVSQDDADFQNQVKNVTGYGWSFVNSGDDAAKTAAMLFLAEEINAMEGTLNLLKRSGVTLKDVPGELNATGGAKEDVLKLVTGMKTVESAFSSNGISSATIRLARLAAIESFVGKYGIPEGAIAAEEKQILAGKLGLTVDDYARLVTLMTFNYNVMLSAHAGE